MSERKEKRIVPAVAAHETWVVVGKDCDRCGSAIPRPGPYGRRDFALEFFTGKSYPDGGTFLDGWSVPDLCDACVRRLRELLVAEGFRVIDAERDY